MLELSSIVRKAVFGLFFLAASLATTGQISETDIGVALYREGKYAEAVEKLAAVVSVDTNNRRAFTYLGGAYLHVKDPKSAKKAFTSAISIKTPKDKKGENKYDTIFPKVTSQPKPSLAFNPEMRLLFPNGRALLAVETLSDGTIGFVFVIKNSTPTWEPLLLQAAQAIKFEPVSINGTNVPSIIVVEYNYSTG